jgi:phage terminase Nu1 subunit (DNA packaging protein)
MRQPMRNFHSVTQEGLAAARGVSVRTIARWTDHGHPRNVDGTYDITASINWSLTRHGHGLNLSAERARLARAQAEKAEDDLAVRRAQLIDRRTAATVWRAMRAAMRERLDRIPNELAPTLAGITDPREAFSVIEDAIHGARREIACEAFAQAVLARVEAGEFGAA